MALKGNGLDVPPEFPTAPYDSIYEVVSKSRGSHQLYEHFSGAWNALAYRFRATCDSASEFEKLLTRHGHAPPPLERYLQENALFAIYSAGFSVFECACYGMFAVGAFLQPAHFLLTSPANQQQVTPGRTFAAYKSAFPTEPITAAFHQMLNDAQYLQFREVRNVLTHRSAPGRRMYISFGDDSTPSAEWKLNNVPLDSSISSSAKQELSRVVSALLVVCEPFVRARI